MFLPQNDRANSRQGNRSLAPKLLSKYTCFMSASRKADDVTNRSNAGLFCTKSSPGTIDLCQKTMFQRRTDEIITKCVKRYQERLWVCWTIIANIISNFGWKWEYTYIHFMGTPN